MKEMTIKLTTIQDVQKFVEVIERCPYAVDLCSGRYVVDAKSLMGIFSLDLLHPIKLVAHEDDPDLLEKLKDFKV